jgi:hypothetical protein
MLVWSQIITRSLVARKILTRLIHRWETKRKYQIREKVFELPPIMVNPNPSKILAVLTTPKTICDAAWAAQSLLRNLPSDLGLAIVIDGDISIDTEQKLKNLFPNIIIQYSRDAMENLRIIAPNLTNYGSSHPLGRKLAMIFWNQMKYSVLYSDADILCFAEIPEIYEAITHDLAALYMQDIGNINADPILLKQLNELNYDFATTLNSGLLYIPHSSFNIEIAEHLLSQKYDPNSWFVEQTVLAVLMKQSEAKPLPKSKYVVSTQRQFYFEEDVNYHQISVRHFTTPVRHLMYLKGMPILWQKWQLEKQ